MILLLLVTAFFPLGPWTSGSLFTDSDDEGNSPSFSFKLSQIVSFSGSGRRLSKDTLKIKNFLPKEGHSFPDLEFALSQINQKSGVIKQAKNLRQVNLVEVSRAAAVERLLGPVFSWQRLNPENKRDVVIYIAPIKHSLFQEQVIAEAIQKVLKKYPRRHHQEISGRTAFVFRSQLKSSPFELKKILALARYPETPRHLGLASQPIRGKWGNVVWIRTTLSRWDNIPEEGFSIGENKIDFGNLSAFHVDPSRKLVTTINLFSKRSSLSKNLSLG